MKWQFRVCPVHENCTDWNPVPEQWFLYSYTYHIDVIYLIFQVWTIYVTAWRLCGEWSRRFGHPKSVSLTSISWAGRVFHLLGNTTKQLRIWLFLLYIAPKIIRHKWWKHAPLPLEFTNQLVEHSVDTLVIIHDWPSGNTPFLDNKVRFLMS